MSAELANEFGTPLYIYDEHTIRQTCRDYLHDFRFADARRARPLRLEGVAQPGPGGRSWSKKASASTSFLPANCTWRLAGGMDPEQIGFHGNGKTPAELEYALDDRRRTDHRRQRRRTRSA